MPIETDTRTPAPGVFSAVGDTIARATELVQIELRLARTELSEKATQMKAGLILVGAGAILLGCALLLVLQFLVAALIDAGLSAMLATLIVAAFTAAVGLVLVASGRKQLDTSNLAPNRTLTELQRDSAIVKEKLS